MVSRRGLLSEASLPGSARARRHVHARHGVESLTKFSRFASTPVTARSASAFDGALASRYGSDLLSLRLRSLRDPTMAFLSPV